MMNNIMTRILWGCSVTIYSGATVAFEFRCNLENKLCICHIKKRAKELWISYFAGEDAVQASTESIQRKVPQLTC